MTHTQNNQFDLFGAPTPSRPIAAAPDAAGLVHWLVVSTRRASTACGIVVTDFDYRERTAVASDGEKVRVSLDGFSVSINCKACGEMLQ